MASPSHNNRYQRALQLWDSFSEFLLADERHLDVFTCKICEDIMRDVTVVTKCQHGFCSQCLHTHIYRDGIHKCPECLTDLGDRPYEYVRFDGVTTILLYYALEYHRLRSTLPPESNTVLPPPPESNTVLPPPPESNTVLPPPPESNTVLPPPPESNTVPPPPPESNTVLPPPEP